MPRLSWSDYFMQITYLVRERSTCLRRKVGAIAVRDNRILATGYNGAPQGLEHCLDRGCLREALQIPSGERHELCRAIHAEQNVLVQAAHNGISLKDATLYCTTFPCVQCIKMLINCGFQALFYVEAYPDPLAAELLKEAHLQSTRLQPPKTLSPEEQA